MKTHVLKRVTASFVVMVVLLCAAFLFTPQQAEAKVDVSNVFQSFDQLDSQGNLINDDIHTFHTKLGTKLRINFETPPDGLVDGIYLSIIKDK